MLSSEAELLSVEIFRANSPPEPYGILYFVPFTAGSMYTRYFSIDSSHKTVSLTSTLQKQILIWDYTALVTNPKIPRSISECSVFCFRFLRFCRNCIKVYLIYHFFSSRIKMNNLQYVTWNINFVSEISTKERVSIFLKSPHSFKYSLDVTKCSVQLFLSYCD